MCIFFLVLKLGKYLQLNQLFDKNLLSYSHCENGNRHIGSKVTEQVEVDRTITEHKMNVIFVNLFLRASVLEAQLIRIESLVATEVSRVTHLKYFRL